MDCIYLLGSNNLKRLSYESINEINKEISKDNRFVIGDSSGIDFLFQQYLRILLYGKVAIYYIGAQPRKALKGSILKAIDNDLKLKFNSVEYYHYKDKKMIEVCDRAIIVWDGKSEDVKTNMAYLDSLNKPYILFNLNKNKKKELLK